VSTPRVAIAGCSLTPFGRADGSSIVDLAAHAAEGALQASKASPGDVDAIYLSTFASAVLGGQNFPAAVLASRIGATPIPAIAVEGACASGSVALKQAINLIRSGGAEAVLVVGAEKMTHRDTSAVTAALAQGTDVTSGGFRAGLTFPGFFALLASAYLRRYDIQRADLASVAVKNRRHGARNPLAHFQSLVTAEEVLASRPIAEPLNLLDCSPISDGAAAIVVATLEWARAHVAVPVEVLACEQSSGPASAEEIDDFTSLSAAREAARRAFQEAGVAPSDIDVAEVHDCFSIAEAIALEDVGLFERGTALAATGEGETSFGGRVLVNPSGGLLSKGHPIGATGVAQIIEIAQQLRGVAHTQAPDPELGLTHNVGGTGGLGSVTILGRAA
jgi:acetyl-CoA C-acetyltransferase